MNTHPRHLRPVAAPPADSPAFDADGWVERARRGDVEAWSRVYEAHHPAVYRRLRYLCGDPAVAEELAQETFARAMAHHASYDGRRPFAGWLFGIALNIARKHHRKQGNKSRAMQRFKDIVPTGSLDDPAGSHLRRERSRMLYTLLDESSLYRPHAQAGSRSTMNVTWTLDGKDDEEKAERTKKFLAQAEAAGLSGLKGHRSVGGCRASIYNAFPQAGVDALCDLMRRFEKTG